MDAERKLALNDAVDSLLDSLTLLASQPTLADLNLVASNLEGTLLVLRREVMLQTRENNRG